MRFSSLLIVEIIAVCFSVSVEAAPTPAASGPAGIGPARRVASNTTDVVMGITLTDVHKGEQRRLQSGEIADLLQGLESAGADLAADKAKLAKYQQDVVDSSNAVDEARNEAMAADLKRQNLAGVRVTDKEDYNAEQHADYALTYPPLEQEELQPVSVLAPIAPIKVCNGTSEDAVLVLDKLYNFSHVVDEEPVNLNATDAAKLASSEEVYQQWSNAESQYRLMEQKQEQAKEGAKYAIDKYEKWAEAVTVTQERYDKLTAELAAAKISDPFYANEAASSNWNDDTYATRL